MSDLNIALRIDAALSGNFDKTFERINRQVKSLSEMGNQLQRQHLGMGQALASAGLRHSENLGRLRDRYRDVGDMINRVTSAQNNLNRAMRFEENNKKRLANAKADFSSALTTGAIIGTPVAMAVKQASEFQDQLIDLSITGGMTAKEQARIGEVVRNSAIKFNQTTSDINSGLSVLVAGGVSSATELEKYAPKMTKYATAWRVSWEDLGNIALSNRNNLGINADGFDRAMNILGYAGKAGQFETRDMSKWMPSLSPYYQAMGVTGERAVAEMGASLQIARMGAGTSDEAANNYRNFLSKMTSVDTMKDFKRAGIDLQGNTMALVAKGMTPMEAMFSQIEQYIRKKSPQAMDKLNQAMNIKDANERQKALDGLSQTYGLGVLFQDQQAMSFIRPMLGNKDKFREIYQGSMKAASGDMGGADFNKRMQSPMEKFKAFKVQAMDLGLTLGNALLPAVTSLMSEVTPLVQSFGNWAKQNPQLVAGAVKLAAGLLATNLAVSGLRLGFAMLLSPIGKAWVMFAKLRGAMTMFSALRLSGIAKLPAMLQAMGMSGGGAMKLVNVLSKVGGWFAKMPKMLTRIPGLLGMVGQAFMALGRAMLFTPIGAVIAAIAVAALLIWKYWKPLKGFFTGFWRGFKSTAGAALNAAWQGVKKFAKGLWDGMKNIPIIGGLFKWLEKIAKPVWDAIVKGAKDFWHWIENLFTPVDDTGKKFETMGEKAGKAFGKIVTKLMELPSKFYQAGADMMNGLMNGIQSKIGAVEGTISSLASSISGRFKSLMQINSPSKLFMKFGRGIAEGTAIGINNGTSTAVKASDNMANKIANTNYQKSYGKHANNANAQSHQSHIHYNPQITVQGNANGDDIKQALNHNQREFERMLDKAMAGKQRRAYA